MSTDYDYTANDVPFDDSAEDIDNYTIADNSAPTRTAEQIAKENTYADIPPGDYVLVVQPIREMPKTDFYKVNVGGVPMSYQAASVRVKFALPDNPRATIEDYFVFPPDDPSEMRAYWEGIPDGKKMAGFNANKFYQFIGALGWPYPAGGKLPPEARRLGNWKGRTIMATVSAGSKYTDRKTGQEKDGRNQVKLFSYRPSEATVAGGANGTANGQSAHQATHPVPAAQRGGSPSPSHRPQPSPAPAGAGIGAGAGASRVAALDL